MYRTRAVLALLVALLAFAARGRAEEDEPAFRGKKLSDWLTMLREDKDVKRRRVALIAVEQIGPAKSRKVLPAVVTALREDPEEQVREASARALGRLILRAVARREDKAEEPPRLDNVRDALAAALRTDKSGGVREAAATALGHLGEEARTVVGALALALQDKHPGTRAAAAEALRKLGKEAREAVPELQQVVKDKNAEAMTRAQAALALGRVGAPDALAAVPALKDVLADAKAPADVRKAAAEALGELGKAAADAAPALGAALTAKTSDTPLRRAAAAALDGLGPDAKPALPALTLALKDEDRFVRCQAMHAIGRIGKELAPGNKEVVIGLLRCLDDSVIEVRVAAVETFGALGAEGLGPDTKAVLDRLSDAARDSNKAVREAAAEALKKIKGTP
jgi:HEAT repeat protein